MSGDQEIVDTHFHIWDTNQFNIPWLSLFEGQLKQQYSLKDYLTAISDLNINQSCYEEVDMVAQQHLQEAKMIIDLCNDQSNQIKGATIGADLSSPDFKAYIEKFANEAVIKSVRHNFFAKDANVSQEAIFRANTQFLAEFGIMCDLVMPVEEMHFGIELVKACPETLFVINHCGVCPIKADKQVKRTWHQGIIDYAANDNTICKISECGFTNPDYSWQVDDVINIIQHCISSFGEKRIVYGTNWPVCDITASISRWLEAINICLEGFPEEYASHLFHKNAKKYYQL